MECSQEPIEYISISIFKLIAYLNEDQVPKYYFS